ncbi:MAG: NAD-dependent epimerase/dehydratase family protein, partial [Rhodovibrionaceae bacterium]
AALGARPLLLRDSFAQAEVEAALRGASHLLSSVPPDKSGDPVLRDLAPCLKEARNLAWAGYLSTTGVYGDRGGGWVDEDTPARPGNPHSQRRAAAEAEWLGLCSDHGLPVQIFRLAGIYGPGRSQIDALKTGRARRIVKPGQVFSRIHVADIASALRASMARPVPGRIYNLADDEPADAAEVVAYAAGLLGIAPPPEIPFEEAELSEMARGFYAECRRVRNLRLRKELGVALAYPSYREGLAAQIEQS